MNTLRNFSQTKGITRSPLTNYKNLMIYIDLSFEFNLTQGIIAMNFLIAAAYAYLSQYANTILVDYQFLWKWFYTPGWKEKCRAQAYCYPSAIL